MSKRRDRRIDDLRLKYRPREMAWNYGLKWMLEKVFVETAWKNDPLIAYPLAIDFAFGTLKYHYLRYGLKSVWMRLWNYNHVMVARIKGEEREDYTDLFTEEGRYNRQLDKEMDELEQDYS